MLYVQLDTNWPDHHKIIEAGVDGAGAHAIILCLAKRLEKDGWVRRSLLRRYAIDDDLLERLLNLRLLEDGDGVVRPAGWLDRNPSQAVLDARKASRAESGKRGNHDRWQHPHPFEQCPKCHPDPQVLAGGDRMGSQEGSGDRSHPYRTQIAVEGEVRGGSLGAIDLEHHPVALIPDELRAQNLAAARALKADRLALVNPKPAKETA